MTDRDNGYLTDILQAIRYIERYDEKDMEEDLKLHGMVYSLIVIGEATKRLSTPVKARYPQVAWPQIVAFRNIVIHEYNDVNEKTAWGIIRTEIPRLKNQIVAILSDLDKDPTHG